MIYPSQPPADLVCCTPTDSKVADIFPSGQSSGKMGHKCGCFIWKYWNLKNKRTKILYCYSFLVIGNSTRCVLSFPFLSMYKRVFPRALGPARKANLSWYQHPGPSISKRGMSKPLNCWTSALVLPWPGSNRRSTLDFSQHPFVSGYSQLFSYGATINE